MEAIQSVTEIDPRELQRISSELEQRSPQDVVRWGIEHFRGGITLACSFGVEDVALVDMIARIDSTVPLFYLDTDYLFPETLEVRDRIVAKYGVHAVAVKPLLTIAEQAAQHGADLYGRQPDLCCKIRKVEPLKRHLGGFQAWITGIRRDQAPTRADAPKWDAKFNLVKVNPLLSWTKKDVWNFIAKHDVPYNPLHDQNYPSIGCWPCTRQVNPGEDPRAGRWANFAKKECGLHTESEAAPAQ